MEKFFERIDKILASTGKVSRSEAKKAAKSGLVKLNGKIVKDCSIKITESDDLIYNGEQIRYKVFTYVMLNKPKGYVCSTDDPSSPIVNTLLPPELQKIGLFSVGRLDKNTTGLVVLTNDGTLAHKVISPNNNVQKIYIAQTKFDISEADIAVFKSGVTLEDGYKCLPAELEILSPCIGKVTIREGKYHQIKRMFEAVNNKVVELKRIYIGELSLDNRLNQGEYKILTDDEAALLYTENRTS